MASFCESFSPEEVFQFIKGQFPMISDTVMDEIATHGIDGETFVALDDDSLREIAPKLCDRVRMKKAVQVALNLTSPVASTVVQCVTKEPQTTEPPAVEHLDVPETSMPVEQASETMDIPAGVCSSSPTIHMAESMRVKSEEPAADWAEKLVIPSRFSVETTLALSRGTPNGKARDDIINSVATAMLVHTMHPSGANYTSICKRLVERHPVLKDSIGSGYDSWKRKLRQKFKNLRRPARAERAGIDVPVHKKRKIEVPSPDEPTSSDIAGYEENCKYLKKVYSSQKWTEVGMATLLEETADQRKKWISKESPTVAVILEKFPCLQEPNLMMSELWQILGTDKATITAKWYDTERKILRYAAQDGRKAVNGLLSQYNATLSDKQSADHQTAYTLRLLAALLQRKGGQSKTSMLATFEGESIDLEKSLQEVDCAAPFIAAFGLTIDSLTDFKLIIEKHNILTMPSLATAVHCCFASYYIFNISYPPHFIPFMLFLEKYVYGMTPSQKKLPISVCTLIDSLDKA